MKSVNKTVLLLYSPQEMFQLVADVARYPEFLPWCNTTRVLESSDADMLAEVGMAFAGIKQSFTTRNTYGQSGAERQLSMRLVKGPFSELHGEWRFSPVGPPPADGQPPTQPVERACRVTLDLRYGFSNGALAMVIGPVFDRIATTLVDAFVKRAEQVYGG